MVFIKVADLFYYFFPDLQRMFDYNMQNHLSLLNKYGSERYENSSRISTVTVIRAWKVNQEKYSMSFTTGGLFIRESINFAKMYQTYQDWELTKNTALSENILQARTVKSAQRIAYEIVKRLRHLSQNEIELLCDGDAQEQKQILWLAVCREYLFIASFASEVLRERLISLKDDLKPEEFDFFLNRKAEWHEEIESLTPSTRAKLRQVMFKMLREADLLNENFTINPIMLSPRLLDAIPDEHKHELTVFPVFEIL
jgi:hypothetical protein